MKAERIILSFVAVLVGLTVAGGAYYAYEHYIKIQPTKTQTVIVHTTPTPTPGSTGDYLTIDQPSDEDVVTNRAVTVTGKATKDSTIIVSTPSSDQVGIASSDGSFSLSTSLDTDTNILYVTAIFPDGTEQKLTRTVTYSTESF